MAGSAYEYALNLLSARAYTTRNLRRKLVQKEFGNEEVGVAMERLVAAGLLDDAKYAEEFARQKLTVGRSSVRRVQQDLARRGIGATQIRSAIDSVMDEEAVDTSHSIDAAARKKLASMGGIELDKKRRRLFGFLARRGFEIADIQRAVEEHIGRG